MYILFPRLGTLPCDRLLLPLQLSAEAQPPPWSLSGYHRPLSSLHKHDLQQSLVWARGLEKISEIPRVWWKSYIIKIYPGNPKRNWGNVQNLSSRINPHTDYSQNYKILPNLQRSENTYLIQWLQTVEKEKSPQLCGSDIHFCLTNTTKTIAIF